MVLHVYMNVEFVMQGYRLIDLLFESQWRVCFALFFFYRKSI